MEALNPLVRHDITTPPSEQDAHTRSRLLCAGVQVFDQKGYDAASVREIVELAGVTKPALYYHFGSKEGLLIAILENAAQQFSAVMTRAAERPGTARERLTAMCEELYGLFSQHVPVIRVAHLVGLGPGGPAPEFDFTVFERALVGALKRIIELGQAAGEVGEGAAEDIALAIMGVIGTVGGRQLRTQAGPAGLELLRRVLAVVFDGVMGDGRGETVGGEQRS